MTSVEVSAKTVEEALTEGLRILGVKKSNAAVEVITEPTQGFLKIIGSREAKIKVSIINEPGEYVKNTLADIMEMIGLAGEVIIDKEDEENIYLEVKGEKLGLLIGKHGNTLNDLQYLINVMLHRQFESLKKRVIIDMENYRYKRRKSLEKLAQNLTYKVLKTKKEVSLEPMTPNERRIIHIALKNNKDVTTYSKGEEPYRKVVIAPK
jgi:spoIIIJ-associated protein